MIAGISKNTAKMVCKRTLAGLERDLILDWQPGIPLKTSPFWAI
jgi:hypothetical protein